MSENILQNSTGSCHLPQIQPDDVLTGPFPQALQHGAERSGVWFKAVRGIYLIRTYP